MGRIFWFVVLVTVLVMVAEAPAEAYLDPGAGSILLQVLLGGFAAAASGARLFRLAWPCGQNTGSRHLRGPSSAVIPSSRDTDSRSSPRQQTQHRLDACAGPKTVPHGRSRQHLKCRPRRAPSAAAGVFAKLFWQSLSATFRRRPSTDGDQSQS